MSITYDQLKHLLTPDDSEKITVGASAFDTPAVTKLWSTAFYQTEGALKLEQAAMTPDEPGRQVTVTGALVGGVIQGVDKGQLSAGVFTLLEDGTVTAKLVININDAGWKFSKSFPSLADSIIDFLMLASPVLTIDSTAPIALPANFRSSFGYPPNIKPVADSLVKGLSFTATLNLAGAIQSLLSPVISFPVYVSGPIEVWYFKGDEFNKTPSLYPEMLLDISAGGQTVNVGSNKFVFNLQTAVLFQEIAAKDPEGLFGDEDKFAVLPTGVLALRCDFTPQGWRTIPISAYIYGDTNKRLRLEAGEQYSQSADKSQLTSLLNGADITSILSPVSGFPVFDQLSLTHVGVELTMSPFAFRSIGVAFEIVSEPWRLFDDLIVIDRIGFSIEGNYDGSSWSASGNIYASAKFAPNSNADVTLTAYVGLPDIYFQLLLDIESKDKEVDLLAPVRQLVGDSIPLPRITGATFSATGNVKQGSYAFEADIKEHWPLIGGENGLVLTEMYLKLAKDKAGVSGLVAGTFSLGGVGIYVSASYSTKGGWIFAGQTLPGTNPNLTALLSDLARCFGFTPPQGLPEIDLNLLSIEYNVKASRMLLDASLSFSDISINLTDLPLVGRYLNPEDNITLSTVTLNIDTTGPTVLTIGVLFGGKLENIVLKFGGASQLEGAVVEDSLLPVSSAPPGIDANSEAGTWINVQKTFGPISVQRIGFRLNNGGLEVMFDASLSFTAFNATIMGLGVTVPLKSPYVPSFDINGLAISYSTASLTIAGAFLKTQKKEYLEFGGELMVRAGNFGLSAIGAYATTSPPSLFAFIMVNAPLGGPPFFYLNGISGGFGYNRNLLMPPIDEVTSYPLVAGSSAASNPFGENPSLAKAMQVMDKYLGVAMGENWVAVGVSVSSFGMVSVSALISVAFGTRFQIALLGIGTLQVPALEPVPIVFAQLAMEALFIPAEGVLSVYAQLTADSYIFTKDCHLTGGFAFCLWFEPTDPDLPPEKNHAGDFVITFGGYNPNFKPEVYYPTVPRLGFNWQVSSLLVIKGGMYFALTPHAVMAGGKLEAAWKSGPISASFMIHADFLIYWKPFHYDIQMGVSFSVQASVNLLFVRVTISVSIGAELHIWGPPFKYRAYIDLYIISFAIGDSEDDSKPKAISWGDFRDSFLDQSANANSGAPAAAAPSFMDRPAAARNWRAHPQPISFDAVRIDAPCTEAVNAVTEQSTIVCVVITDGVIQDLSRSGATIDVHPDPNNPERVVKVPIDYVVDPQHFSMQTQSLAPSKELSYNSNSGVGSWGVDQTTWNTDFGISPMHLDPASVSSTHTVTVCRLTDCMLFDGFDAKPYTAKASKAMWLYQKNLDQSLNQVALLDNLLQGLTLEPKVVTPAHSVPVKVITLEYDPEGTVEVSWGANPAPNTDPFGGLNPNSTLANTIGNEEVAAVRSGIIADLFYNGFALGNVFDTEPMEDEASLNLLSPVTLSYLGEPKTIGSANT
jgi:hypothetical protein